MYEQALGTDTVAQLYDSHALKAFRYARAMGLNDADADDAVSESFLRVIKAQASFRGDAAFGTWLFSVLRTTVLNVVRSERRRGRLSAQSGDDPVSLDDPVKAVARKEYFAELSQAIAALAPERRSALSLVVFGGLTLKEAAQAEGVTEPALASRLFQARKAIRAHLTQRHLLES
ncbi:MAG: sigma-70 family RNA polymerase sigma factor [Planctomycetota bacterium]|nr:sigma-70 family RNA polymerase sigma factor [Planctomycetota bacterium]